MKQSIAELLGQALDGLPEFEDAPEFASLSVTVERTRDPRHGDFASNVAMRLARAAGRNPRELAAEIIERLPASRLIAKAEIAGPGFINFHVGDAAFHDELATILEKGGDYGRQPRRESPKVLLEFVSANPAGPLHVGHGRHAP